MACDRCLGNVLGMTYEQEIRAGQIVSGMNFDQKVWAVTTRIPAGQLATYGQIAAFLGNPKAARAVGGALNRNPYAPAVPCHRVVGSTGALTGFAGGIPKKVELLQNEGIAVKGVRVVTIPRVCF